MKQPTFTEANRVQVSWLAPLERRCLIWLAHRLPAWVSSDQLTPLGFSAMFLAGASYGLARWNRWALLLVIFWLAVNWFGDSLDGTLARVRQTQRPRYGFYVDHIVDTLGILFLMGGVALSDYMSWFVAGGALIAYFMLSIEVYLATYALGSFRFAFFGFSPTELRLLIAIGNVWVFFNPTVGIRGKQYRFLDVAGVIAIAVIGVTFVTSVIRNTIKLHRLEPLPTRTNTASCGAPSDTAG